MPLAFCKFDNPVHLCCCYFCCCFRCCCCCCYCWHCWCYAACLPACLPPSLLPLAPLHTPTPATQPRHTEIALTIASPTAWQRTRCAAQISYRIYSAARARAVASIYFCRLCVYNSAQRSVSQNRCDCGRSSRANDWTNERTNEQRNERTDEQGNVETSFGSLCTTVCCYIHTQTYIHNEFVYVLEDKGMKIVYVHTVGSIWQRQLITYLCFLYIP